MAIVFQKWAVHSALRWTRARKSTALLLWISDSLLKRWMHLAKLESIVSEKGDMRQMLVIFPNFFPWDTQLWDWIYLWHDIICKVLFLCLEKKSYLCFSKEKYTKTCLNIATGTFNEDLKGISNGNPGKPFLLPKTINCQQQIFLLANTFLLYKILSY